MTKIIIYLTNVLLICKKQHLLYFNFLGYSMLSIFPDKTFIVCHVTRKVQREKQSLFLTAPQESAV